MVKSPRLFFIGASLLLLAGIRSAQATEIKIVSPSAYEDREGEIGGGGGDSAMSPQHYQALFPAEDFAALGNQPHWLVDITFRPDQNVTSPRTVYYPYNEVRITTTQIDNLSLLFDENLGSDFKPWYLGPVNFVSDVDGPGPGPSEFYETDYSAGVTPYLYDPSKGNLLSDVIAWQGWSPADRGDQVPGMLTALVGSPGSTQGVLIPAGIFQFTFVPVPEPSSLTLFAVMLALGSLWRRATTAKTASVLPTT